MKRIAALLLVMCMILAFAACGKKEPPAAEIVTTEATAPVTLPEPDPIESDVTVMSHAEYIAAEPDSMVAVETYVQATEAWWNNLVNIYAQSEDGAYFIREAECSQDYAAKLVPGTKIRVNGFKLSLDDMDQIVNATIEIMEGSYISGAADVTEFMGSPDTLILHQNEKVSFSGMTIEASNQDGAAFLYGATGSEQPGTNSDLYFQASVGGKSYTFVVESDLCDENTECYKTVTNLKVGDIVRMEGFLYWFGGSVQPHITSVTPATTAANGQ